MSRNTTRLMLAAFTVAPSLLSGTSWAVPPEAAEPAPVLNRPVPTPTPPPVWGHSTEAVRTSYAAVHDACAAWPKQVPLALDPSIALSSEADEPYVSICKLALDPRGFAEVSLLKGFALGAAAAGVAVVVFQLAKLVLFGLGRVVRRGLDALRRGLEALWDRRPPRLGGWSG